MYGPGKSYNVFAGKDGSKGLGLSSLKPEVRWLSLPSGRCSVGELSCTEGEDEIVGGKGNEGSPIGSQPTRRLRALGLLVSVLITRRLSLAEGRAHARARSAPSLSLFWSSLTDSGLFPPRTPSPTTRPSTRSRSRRSTSGTRSLRSGTTSSARSLGLEGVVDSQVEGGPFRESVCFVFS